MKAAFELNKEVGEAYLLLLEVDRSSSLSRLRLMCFARLALRAWLRRDTGFRSGVATVLRGSSFHRRSSVVEVERSHHLRVGAKVVQESGTLCAIIALTTRVHLGLQGGDERGEELDAVSSHLEDPEEDQPRSAV